MQYFVYLSWSFMAHKVASVELNQFSGRLELLCKPPCTIQLSNDIIPDEMSKCIADQYRVDRSMDNNGLCEFFQLPAMNN